jgi:hypothetical protein
MHLAVCGLRNSPGVLLHQCSKVCRHHGQVAHAHGVAQALSCMALLLSLVGYCAIMARP